MSDIFYHLHHRTAHVLSCSYVRNCMHYGFSGRPQRNDPQSEEGLLLGSFKGSQVEWKAFCGNEYRRDKQTAADGHVGRVEALSPQTRTSPKKTSLSQSKAFHSTYDPLNEPCNNRRGQSGSFITVSAMCRRIASQCLCQQLSVCLSCTHLPAEKTCDLCRRCRLLRCAPLSHAVLLHLLGSCAAATIFSPPRMQQTPATAVKHHVD